MSFSTTLVSRSLRSLKIKNCRSKVTRVNFWLSDQGSAFVIFGLRVVTNRTPLSTYNLEQSERSKGPWSTYHLERSERLKESLSPSHLEQSERPKEFFVHFWQFHKFCRDMKFFLWLVLILEIKFEFRIDKDCLIKLVPSFLSGHFEVS